MKTIYFVRHGESESNARTQTIYKGKQSRLTEKGRKQTEMIAERAAHIRFDALISSTWLRARETAEAISRKTGKSVEFSDLFAETNAPSSLDGMFLTDPVLIGKLAAWNRSVFDPVGRVEDGENFSDLRARADKALAYLLEREEPHLLVATHGLFLRMLMATVMLGDLLTPELFLHFVSATKTENTGITVFTYGPLPHHETDAGVRWRIRVFNDHAHLG